MSGWEMRIYEIWDIEKRGRGYPIRRMIGRVIVEDSKELWPVRPKGWPFVSVRVWIGKEHIVPVVYEETADKFLIHIDTAKKEILAADSLIKVKALWNKADAIRQLGQAAKDPDLINFAMDFKLRCERRLGEMLAAM